MSRLAFLPYDDMVFHMKASRAQFEWNDGKDAVNRQKHGVSFALAQYAFADPHRVILEDMAHSQSEKRFYCLGEVAEGIMPVRFTYRGSVIRIFGAGYWRKGKRIYEDENKIH
jgi:uncharacterized DUF497 family protein